MLDGTEMPNKAEIDPITEVRISRLWPEENKENDRVEEQLMFIPPNYQYENAPIKKILLYNDIGNWMVDNGQNEFLSNDCPVNRCIILKKISYFASVDAVIFREKFFDPFYKTGLKRSSKQVPIIKIKFYIYLITL